MSIVSMLSSTKEKKKPVNDTSVCKAGWKSPKEANWIHNYKDV